MYRVIDTVLMWQLKVQNDTEVLHANLNFIRLLQFMMCFSKKVNKSWWTF